MVHWALLPNVWEAAGQNALITLLHPLQGGEQVGHARTRRKPPGSRYPGQHLLSELSLPRLLLLHARGPCLPKLDLWPLTQLHQNLGLQGAHGLEAEQSPISPPLAPIELGKHQPHIQHGCPRQRGGGQFCPTAVGSHGCWLSVLPDRAPDPRPLTHTACQPHPDKLSWGMQARGAHPRVQQLVPGIQLIMAHLSHTVIARLIEEQLDPYRHPPAVHP